MKRLVLLLLSSQVCFFQACEKMDFDHNPDGSVAARKFLWKTPISLENYVATGIQTSITYNNGVLAPCATGAAVVEGLPSRSDKGGLIMLDADTGKERWRWADYLFSRESFDIHYGHIYDGCLLISNSPRSHCIDLNTGKTIWQKWKQDTVYSVYTMTGIGDKYFFCGHIDKPGEARMKYALYEGNVLEPTPEKMIVNPQLPVEYFGDVLIPTGAVTVQVTVADRDTLLVVDYQTPTAQARFNYIRPVFGLYNYSDKSWVYQDIPLVEPGQGTVVDGVPIIHEGKVYHTVDRYITCHDLLSGQLIWRQEFTQNFSVSGFVIAEGLVVGNCQNGNLYGLDALTGSVRWIEKSSGSSTKLVYQDGFVYFTGGGNGLLHAVEVQTGKTHWKLRSQDAEKDSWAFFHYFVAGIPAQGGKKGKVFASTGINIVCYEAIR